MPLILTTEEIYDFLKKTIDFGLSNYYLSSSNLEFQWIFTICSEGDFHIAGDKIFVNSAEIFLNNIR